MPAGRIDAGESPEQAAARETLEETGWRPGPLTHLVTYHPNNGQSDLRFHLFLADGATHVGEPIDWAEVERVDWLTVDELRGAPSTPVRWSTACRSRRCSGSWRSAAGTMSVPVDQRA